MTGLAEFGDAIEAGAVLVDNVSDELCGVFRLFRFLIYLALHINKCYLHS